MFVKKNKNSAGRIVLAYYEGYRDKNGIPRQKHIKRIGFLDDLEKLYDDPLAHFKAEAKRLTEEAKANNQDSITVSLDMNQRTPINQSQVKNLGYVFLQSVYSSLKLPEFFKNKQRNTKIEYNFNNVICLLVFSRILKPESKIATFKSSSMYFEKLASSSDAIYDVLTRLYPLRNELQAYLHESVKAKYGRSNEHAFFDCTNYYFEIDSEKGIRKKGPSKEHRKTPIVQMGLLMDSNGIPMAYHLFPGNESEKVNLRPVINRCKIDYNIGRVIVVADRGLNTSDNIFYTHGKGDGYVYSQSIRGADKKYRDWVLDEDGYITHNDHSDTITGDDENEVIDAFKIKSRIIGKTIKIEENGKRNHEVTIKQKQVVYYSPKYAKRQKMKRLESVEKAQRLIESSGKYTQASNYGCMNYIEENVIDQSTGELLQKKKNDNIMRHINYDKIEEEEKYDGYYSIVTSETNLSDIEILNTYRGLWKIEESFKITKSELESRPAHVSRDDHIESHFFTCFLSLLLIRVIEHEIERKYSPQQLIEGLRSFNYTLVTENIYQCLNRNEIIDLLDETFGLDTSKYRMTLAKIKNIIATSKKE
ncbi:MULTISPECIES: IS1634 family transposase [unclassified Breznakia]|uniref:IS1634 family transposase n=1 Tax=unclassified Breznakia TaxID=2623764 RepID=UPI002474A812|nr:MULTISPECIES: IS1634 family transposase [unclassified Breznakia]MDH6366484.1 transposase [Breznakia sp. PH1-1]MDH6403577.1 transposase [Breznakia sp. PF1-11]MDH6411286.1 transposase [Breznakia sp. PFB1-11]MDH6413738.1 transposase [Breznakia sp. PFB1-14]MDH6415831.1 transposase [Breznakia sp. PFB1-4]